MQSSKSTLCSGVLYDIQALIDVPRLNGEMVKLGYVDSVELMGVTGKFVYLIRLNNKFVACRSP